MLHQVEDGREAEDENLTERRESFMETVSTYLNGVETKFGWFVFEAIVNNTGENHLQDSFFAFRK